MDKDSRNIRIMVMGLILLMNRSFLGDHMCSP